MEIMQDNSELPTATRKAGLERLDSFVSRAGRDYAARRNYDTGPSERRNVSMLSPYVRHRLVSEQEVVAAVLARHAPTAAEKFVQEVCWRTYWKGWLEMRPEVWRHYVADLGRLQDRAAADRDLADRLGQAEAAATGIACFNAWVHELVSTGYLHNHTRMWFASIWVYTLELPWQLGADLFMRHLLDGDPASNTLSWRWVCGLQTAGKTYLARAGNIDTYTGGRFNPQGQLAASAPPLSDDFDMPRPVRPARAASVPEGRFILLLGEDDLSPETWPIKPGQVAGVVGLDAATAYPAASGAVVTFKRAALDDAVARARTHYGCAGAVVETANRADGCDRALAVIGDMAVEAGVSAVVAMRPPVGPAADASASIFAGLGRSSAEVHLLRRQWDDLLWPHASAGFFKFKDKLPGVLQSIEPETYRD